MFGDDDATEIVLDGDDLEIIRPRPDPDLIVATTAAALVEARQSGQPLVATVDGSSAARAAFVEVFRLPLG